MSWAASRALLRGLPVLVLLTLGGSRTGRADDQAEARMHFERGQELFNAKKFLEAAQEFEAGFAAVPRPLFLLNIGHSYRRAHEFRKAKRAYETLLRVEPETPYREEVLGLIKTCNDTLEESEPSRAAGTEKSILPAQPPVAVVGEPARPFAVGRAAVADEPAPSRPVWRSPWFWGATLAAAVVVGTVVAVVKLSGAPACTADRCVHE